MNIGIFTNAYKPIISGVVNSISLFRQGLMSLGHNVYIFAPAFPGYKDQEENVHRFRSINLTTRVKYPLAIPLSNRIFGLLPKLKLDIIHTQHPYILGEVGAHFAKKFNIPLVYTFHTQFEQYSHYIPLNQNLVKKLAKISVINYTQKCDCIITPAPSIKEVLLSYGITRRIELLPNAIDLAAYENPNSKPVRQKYGIPREAVVLLYVGRIGLEKNLGFMLQAFQKLLEKEKNLYLMIVGDGPEEDAIKDLSRQMGIGEHTIFTGKIDYAEIPMFYAAGDIFIMTSVTEVKPLALLEAMATGIPVVAVAASGSSDTITSGLDGILTELDLDDFVSECFKLIHNRELRKQMGQHAKATSRNYSIDSTSRRLLEIYEDLIKIKRQESLSR